MNNQIYYKKNRKNSNLWLDKIFLECILVGKMKKKRIFTMEKEFNIELLNAKFASAEAKEIVEWTLEKIGARNFVLASSMSVESQVLTDMLLKRDNNVRILMLDTGRLNQETYDVLQWTKSHYGVNVEIAFPDSSDVEEMVFKKGINLFYDSVENRKLCCEIRKVRPLCRKLAGVKAWMTGLKRSDSELRSDLPKIEWDAQFSLLKLNPLADWSDEKVWNYIKEKGIQPNKLYSEGYKSIGCAPCTRAVLEGEDIRSGRWWWEPRSHSECGLHVVNGKLIRHSEGNSL